MLHLLDCALLFALFLGVNYPVSLTLGCCSDFAVATGNLLSGFIPLSIAVLLIRKAGFSLSKLTRKKKKSPSLS